MSVVRNVSIRNRIRRASASSANEHETSTNGATVEEPEIHEPLETVIVGSPPAVVDNGYDGDFHAYFPLPSPTLEEDEQHMRDHHRADLEATPIRGSGAAPRGRVGISSTPRKRGGGGGGGGGDEHERDCDRAASLEATPIRVRGPPRNRGVGGGLSGGGTRTVMLYNRLDIDPELKYLNDYTKSKTHAMLMFLVSAMLGNIAQVRMLVGLQKMRNQVKESENILGDMVFGNAVLVILNFLSMLMEIFAFIILLRIRGIRLDGTDVETRIRCYDLNGYVIWMTVAIIFLNVATGVFSGPEDWFSKIASAGEV